MASSVFAALLGLGGNALEYIGGQNLNQWLQNSMANRLNGADAWSSIFFDMARDNYGPLRDQALRQLDLGNQFLFGGDDGGAMGRQDAATRDFLSRVSDPNFFSPGLTPGQEEDIRNSQGILGRIDPAYDSIYNALNSGGRTFDSNLLRDRLFDTINGAQSGELFNVGNELLSTRGLTGFNQNALDRAQDVFNQGGQTAASQGLGGAGFNLIGAGGWNPQNTAALQNGQNFANFALQGGGYTPETAGMAQSAMGLFNSTQATGGYTPQITQGLANAQDFYDTQSALASGTGMTPGLDTVMTNAQNNIGNGEAVLGNAQNLFDWAGATNGFNPQLQGQYDAGMGFLNQAATGGGYDSQINSFLGQAAGLLGGGGVSASRPSFSNSPETSAAFARLASGGRTDWTDYLRDRARGIYDGSESALLPEQTMIDFARDQAATSGRNAAEAAYRRAFARGAQPGSVVASGAWNDAMNEFADSISQNEATQVQNALLQRMGLSMQERQNADQLGLGIAGAENQRYGTDASLAASLRSSDVSRYGADAGMYGSELAARNAAMGAGASLAAAGLNAAANRYGSQLGAGTNLATGATQTAAGIFNNAVNTALGTQVNAMGQINNAIGQQNTAQDTAAGRVNTAAQAALGGLNAFNDANNTAANRYNTGLGAATDLLGSLEAGAASRFGNAAGASTDFFNTALTNATANNRLGLDMVTQAQQSEIDRLNTFRAIAGDAMGDQRARMALGGDLLGQNATIRQNAVNSLNTLLGEENDLYLGALTGLNNLAGTQNSINNSIMNYRLGAQNQNANERIAWTNAYNTALNQSGNNITRFLDLMNGGTNILGNLTTNLLNNAGNLQVARTGVNPPSMTNPWAGIGQTAANAAQGLINTIPSWGGNPASGAPTTDPNNPNGWT